MIEISVFKAKNIFEQALVDMFCPLDSDRGAAYFCGSESREPKVADPVHCFYKIYIVMHEIHTCTLNS